MITNIKRRTSAHSTERLFTGPSYPTQQPSDVFVIGDLHLPFEHTEYLKFCQHYYEHLVSTSRRKVQVVFIGDVIDNHATSNHQQDHDGFSAGTELAIAQDRVKDWYRAFPDAKVCIGNHDTRPRYMAKQAKISREWFKSLGEVLGTPGWEFADEFVIDNVLYTHGKSGHAWDMVLYKGMSVVQGHYHTEFGVRYVANGKFGMQVGCGVDVDSYAMDYAKKHKKPYLIGCGAVVNGTPMVLPMY